MRPGASVVALYAEGIAATTSAMAPFHTVIADWFRACLGEPTSMQALAWERRANR